VVEEGADIIVLRRGEKELEINAFLIPAAGAYPWRSAKEALALADGDAFDAPCAPASRRPVWKAPARAWCWCTISIIPKKSTR
jgi:hypothetical protein